MYIQNKLVSAFYKLLLGFISLGGFWATLALFGLTAWRLFSTWALLIGAVYFCLSALIIALSSKRPAGDIPCAMLEGMLIVAFAIQGVTAVACAINDEYLPGLGGAMAILAYYILPILTLLDWCIFNKKGQWRPVDPFYWLALPLAYSAMILFTANILPSSTTLLYPVAFLDYNTYGLPEMFSWLVLLGLLILVFGYILLLLDAFMGGIISQHIVLPRIRTVVVDETGSPETTSEEQSEGTTASRVDDFGLAEDSITQPEEIEIVEPDEIITPKSKNSSPKPRTAASSKTQASSARRQPQSGAQASSRNQTTRTQSAKKSAGSKNTNRRRKINDITKPKTPQPPKS